jgi:hypothetical protein
LPVITSEESCIPVEPATTLTNFPPNLVVYEENENSIASLYLLGSDLTVEAELASQDEVFDSAVVSPDSKWLAFIRHDFGVEVLEEIVLFSSTQEQFTVTPPWEENSWGGLAGWINGNQLHVVFLVEPHPFDDKWAMIFNPFTGEKTEVDVLSFPGAHPREPYWRDGTDVVFSPDLTRLIYPGEGNTLFDWKEKHDIAVVSNWNFETTPQWSPDGSKFVTLDASIEEPTYEQPQVVVIRSKDGELLVTYQFKRDDWISDFSWSPDSSRVAFWVSNDGASTLAQYLTILDLETHTMSSTCLRSFYRGEGGNVPVWSPNSRFISFAYVDTEESNFGPRRLMVVDMLQENAFLSERFFEPVGWLNE